MSTPYPLGRTLSHDPRSRNFAAPLAPALKTVMHTHYGPVLDQGNLGSCTGNALSQALNTKPLHARRGKYLTEADAVRLYSAATRLDEFDGEYPPTDTGSSGLAVCKAALAEGLIRSYSHAFGLDQCLAALVLQPVIVGTEWTDAMFEPDSKGFVHPTGNVAGGHEYCLLGLNVRDEYVTAINNWSVTWGLRGRFRIRFADLGTLLQAQGDVTVPTV